MLSQVRSLGFWCVLCVGVLCLAIPAYADKSGVGPTVLSLPSGPGSIGGIGENVQANLNMGLMTYPIKILVPQGRGQATPQPSVSYSSSAGAGLMGIGWSFSVGAAVERLTVRGLPTYTNEDRFYAGGELVKIPGSSFYRARIEGGFIRYQWIQKGSSSQQGYWVSEFPDGSKGYYGADSKGNLDLDSQVYGLQGTFRWELRTLVDRNGNRVEYAYFKDGPQAYLDTISWVFNKNNKPLYQLSVVYEDRPDPISDGKPGFDLQTLKRIKEIRITSAGKQFRTYKFAFEDSTGLSRLIKVTRYGQDGKTPHPVQFSMKYSNATFSAKTSRLVTMPTALGIDFANGKADFLDINGDGLPDVIDTSKSNHVFHLNTLTLDQDMKQKAHDFPASAKVTNAKATSGAQLSNASVQMIDYNGDGFTDMVDAVNKAIYINKGNGQWEDNSGTLTSFPVDGKDADMRFFDYNGDKAIDVISSNGSVTTYWVSNGKGEWKQVDGKPNLGASVSKDRIRFIDINGDGLNDAVQILPKNMRFKKYLGYGQWSDWIDVKVPQLEKYELNTKAQFSDINGDGMADMVAFLGTSIVYFVNKNGREFAEPVTIQDFGGQAIPNSTKTSVRIADINGNGSRDIVWIDNNGKITYLELFSERPNLMREISNGIGQRINIEYGSSVYFYLRDKSCDKEKHKACSGPWQNKMPMAFTVVTKINTWASRSDKPADQSQPIDDERPNTQTIYYHNGFYDGIEKKFRGFRHVETLFDGDSSVGVRKDEIRYDVGDTDSYFHGKLLERTISDGQGGIYHQIKMKWDECPVNLGKVEGKDLDPPVRYICMSWNEKTYIEKQSDKTKWKTVRTEMSHDGFGNVIQEAMLGEKDKQGDEKYVKIEYITPSDPNAVSAKWLLRAPQKEWRCTAPPDSNEPCAETEYYYDGEPLTGLPLGQLEKGNLVRVRMRVQPGKDEWRVPMRRQYDQYGNMIVMQAFDAHKRTITWDDEYARFSTKEEIDMGSYKLTATTRWDVSYGNVIQSTNYNGHNIVYTYDTFGRITSMGRPGDDNGKPSMRYSYELKAPISRIIIEKRSRVGGDFDRKQIICFDGLGRKLSTRQMVGDNQYIVYTHVEYNRLNLRARLWDTYQADEKCSFSAPQDTPVVSFQYDGLGRRVRRINQDGHATKQIYLPLMRLEYDEEDNRKDSPHYDTPRTVLMDGLGRIIQEIEIPQKGETITTSYTYNARNVRHDDKIAVVTFHDGSQKKHEYDLLGNVLKSTDPDRKETTYTYNAQNLLVERKDARGRAIVLHYDSLGRVLTKQEKDQPDTKITYTYDTLQQELPTATNLKGYISKISYPGGSYLFSYDGTGQPTLERHTLMGVNFDFKREYDNEGNMVAKTYPDGRRVEFTLDAAARPIAIPGKLKQITYHPNGLLKSWTGANGISTQYTYNLRQWPTQIKVADGKVMRLDHTMDWVGNISSIAQQHGSSSFTDSYTYDSLYRLTKASLGNQQDEVTYKLDGLHNVTAKMSMLEQKSPVHLGVMEYDKKSIHRLTKAGAIKLSYDDAGHVLKRGDYTMSWDYHGRCKEVKKGEQVISRAWYNNQTMRVIKEENGLHTFYLDDLFEIHDGTAIAFVKLGRNRVVGFSSQKMMATFFDDLAPASGDKELKSGPDGKITAGDAWLYHASRNKLVSIAIKKRPIDIDMTQDMLRVSLTRLLDGEQEQVRYYHADHIGSVRAITDAKGEVVARRHYYPYGAIRTTSGQAFRYSYMNAEYDSVTGHYRFLMRSLDPVLGRWLSPDPMFHQIHTETDEFNSYGMVQNNPIRMREFQGTFSLFGLSDDTTTSIMDYGIMVLGAVGFIEYASAAYDSMKSSASTFSPGQRAARKANQLASGLFAMSYALWGAASAAREFGAGDTAYRILSGAMFTMWAASEAASTWGAWKAHKTWKKAGRGGKAILGVRAAMTAAVMTGGIMSTAVDGQVGEIAGYASMGLFVFSAVLNKWAASASAKRDASLSRRMTTANADVVARTPTFGTPARERKGGLISRGLKALMKKMRRKK